MRQKKIPPKETTIEDIYKIYFRYIETGKLEKLKLLISENNIDINAVKTATGNNALLYAVHFKKIEIIKYLISCGADTTIVNNSNESANDLANGDKKILDLLNKKRLFFI